jgi:RNA polymerase sigma-70 factor (ECF subfamily)
MYVFYFCKKIINHREDAEDITSFVFVKLWENKDRIAPTSAKAFLLVTAKHKCQDYFRMKRRHDDVMECITLYDLDEMDIENTVIEYLYTLVQRLTTQEKKLLLLKYREGKEVKEISKLLRLNPQNVSNIIYNSIKKLKSLINIAH